MKRTRPFYDRESRTYCIERNTPPRDVILIVCEGAVTEPTYFKCLKKKWRLHPTQVIIAGKECESAPIRVVDHAIHLKQERESKTTHTFNAPPFDQVWAVIDFDNHESLNRALNKARDHDVKVALSRPCFEYWYLLHFTDSTKDYRTCSTLIKDLKKYIKTYSKTDASYLDDLLPKTLTALTNADKVRKTQAQSPKTNIDLLVKELQQLK